jgi:CDP-diglyceride synthetase
VEALWVFVPVLGAPLAHAPVLALDLLPSLKRPLDGGRSFRGTRVFGDNKTWRGAIVMTAGVLAATLILSRWDWYWSKLPGEIESAGPVVFGLVLGVAVVAGELPGSFVKRRLGIAPGRQRRSPLGIAISLWDQADFVPVVWLFLLPIWVMSVSETLIAFVVVTAVHLVINVIGYGIGARTAPI